MDLKTADKKNYIEIKNKKTVIGIIPVYSVHKVWGFDKQNEGITVRYVKVDAGRVMRYIGEKDFTFHYISNARHDYDTKNLCYAIKLSNVEVVDGINAYVEFICFGVNEIALRKLSETFTNAGLKCPCSSQGTFINSLGYFSKWKTNMKANMQRLAEEEQWMWLA